MSRILILDPKKEVKKEVKELPSAMRERGRDRSDGGGGADHRKGRGQPLRLGAVTELNYRRSFNRFKTHRYARLITFPASKGMKK